MKKFERKTLSKNEIYFLASFTMDTSKITPQLLLSVLNTLSEREKQVLILRFGLFNTNSHTLRETGKKLHNKVTQERVRQIEAKACRKLRHPSRLNKIFTINEAENNWHPKEITFRERTTALNRELETYKDRERTRVSYVKNELSKKPQTVKELDIKCLNLPPKLLHALYNNDIWIMGDLIKVYKNLDDMKNIGPWGKATVIHALASLDWTIDYTVKLYE